MTWFLNLKNEIIVAALAILIGFGLGYHYKSVSTKAATETAVAKADQKVITGAAKDIKKADQIDAGVQAKLDEKDKTIESIRQRLQDLQDHPPIRYVTSHSPSNEVGKNDSQPAPAASSGPNDVGTAVATVPGNSCFFLDNESVRLLNAAREGVPVDSPAGAGYAAGVTFAPVSAWNFIDNDLTVVKRYNDLAEKHNSLVDYVQTLLDKQAQ